MAKSLWFLDPFAVTTGYESLDPSSFEELDHTQTIDSKSTQQLLSCLYATLKLSMYFSAIGEELMIPEPFCGYT